MCGGVVMLNTTVVTLYLSGANSVWRSRHVEDNLELLFHDREPELV